MDPKIEERLAALEQMVAENNKILKRMRGVQRNANLMKLMYWVVIIVISFGAYFFIKPYLQMLGGVYGVGKGGNSTDVNSILDQYKQLQQEIN